MRPRGGVERSFAWIENAADSGKTKGMGTCLRLTRLSPRAFAETASWKKGFVVQMTEVAWVVAAVSVLLTGISKSGLGGALGGLAVPVMSIWLSPRDAVAMMLPILIATDLVGIRAWRAQASWPDLRPLLLGAILGIAVGTLAFGLMSDRLIKGVVGSIAVAFALDRLIRKRAPSLIGASDGINKPFAFCCGAGAGFTSTLAHAGGPPVMIYLLGRGLSRQGFVASSVYFFTVVNLAKLPFYFALDLFTTDTLLASLCLLPLVPIGVWLGLRVLARIPERPFYLFATWALGISGVMLLWGSLAAGS